MWTLAGSSARNCGSSALDGVGDGDRVGAGLALNAERDRALLGLGACRTTTPVRGSSTPSTIVPSCSSRTGELLRYEMIWLRYSSAFISCPLACSVNT